MIPPAGAGCKPMLAGGFPRGSRELFQLRRIAGVRIAVLGRRLPFQGIEDLRGEHGANGMNRIVPGEPLLLQSAQRFNDRRDAQRELILNDDVEGRVDARIRYGLLGVPVKGRGDLESLTLVKSQPFRRPRSAFRIVVLHALVSGLLFWSG